MRTILAFLIAPIMPITIWLCILIIPDFDYRDTNSYSGIENFVAMIYSFGLIFSWVVIVLYAVPAYFLLKYFRKLNPYVIIALAGFFTVFHFIILPMINCLMGFEIPVFTLWKCGSLSKSFSDFGAFLILIRKFGFLAMLGMVGGLTFWLIFNKGRWRYIGAD